MNGSPQAKTRLTLVLQTLTGQRTVAEAAGQLGVSEAAFHKMRTRCLQRTLAEFEPRSPIIAVRDLASGCELTWKEVPDATATPANDKLKNLFEEHGPPLVLKADLGSAFTSRQTRQLLLQFNVLPLLSPPRYPQYNGAAEAGIRSMKTRTRHQAGRRGQPTLWSSDDLQAARIQANTITRPRGPRGPTPQQLFDNRPTITPPPPPQFRKNFVSTALHHLRGWSNSNTTSTTSRWTARRNVNSPAPRWSGHSSTPASSTFLGGQFLNPLNVPARHLFPHRVQ